VALGAFVAEEVSVVVPVVEVPVAAVVSVPVDVVAAGAEAVGEPGAFPASAGR
jgi:hypothetical protein